MGKVRVRWLPVAALCSGLMLCGAVETKPFGGEEAAWVDWAFQNCGVTATPKERALVDAAVASGSAGFQKAYEQQYRKIVEQARNGEEIKKLCKSMRTWYGPEGEKEPGLIAEQSDGSRLAPPVSGSTAGATPAPQGPAPRQGGSIKKGGF